MFGKSNRIIRMFGNTPKLADLESTKARIIIAMRVAVMAHGQNLDIRDYLINQFKDETSGKRFAFIMETMGACWPEPVRVHRPCCSVTTYDEMLLVELMGAVVRDEAWYFHELINDMISESERHRLHQSISRFIHSFYHIV